MKAIAIALVLSVACVACSAEQDQRPNIVLIVSDDMGYGDVGVFGCKDIETPNIDRLAREGVVFTDAYVSGPICSPSRLGLMTGRYPSRWGIYTNEDVFTAEGLEGTAAETTVATLLRKEGYRTGIFGKWHLCADLFKAPEENRPERLGFDEVCVVRGGMASYRAGTPLYGGDGREVKAPEYLTDHFGKLSADFIGRNKHRPFFLYLAFTAPHAPLEATREDMARYESIADQGRRTYAGMMAALDRNVGRVLDALAEAEIEDDTLVVFLSDNGGPSPTSHATSRNMASNLPLRGFKGDVYEGGVRTPMIMKWPGHLAPDSKFGGMVSSLDVAPTFLSAARHAAPLDRPLDGQDLVPYLDGRTPGEPHAALCWEWSWFSGPPLCRFGVRRGDWKAVQVRRGADGPVPTMWQLYDLSNDIGEARDLATHHPEKVAELAEAFRDWRAQMATSCTLRERSRKRPE